jgi:hypothetical protein
MYMYMYVRCYCLYMQSLGSQVHLESKFATYIQNEVRRVLYPLIHIIRTHIQFIPHTIKYTFK